MRRCASALRRDQGDRAVPVLVLVPLCSTWSCLSAVARKPGGGSRLLAEKYDRKKCGKLRSVTTCVSPPCPPWEHELAKQALRSQLSMGELCTGNTEHTHQAQLRTRNKHGNTRCTNTQSADAGTPQGGKCSLSLDKVLVCSPPQVIFFRNQPLAAL